MASNELYALQDNIVLDYCTNGNRLWIIISSRLIEPYKAATKIKAKPFNNLSIKLFINRENLHGMHHLKQSNHANGPNE